MEAFSNADDWFTTTGFYDDYYLDDLYFESSFLVLTSLP